MGAAGNKKPKGMHKKHAPAYQVEEAIHENDLKKGKKKSIIWRFILKRVIFRVSEAQAEELGYNPFFYCILF